MIRIPAILQISAAVTSLTVMLLFAADALQLIPDARKQALIGRGHLCEALAFSVSAFAERSDPRAMEGVLRAIVSRNQEIRSIGIRGGDDTLLLEIGQHSLLWPASVASKEAGTNVRVPITRGSSPWGTVEVCFTSLPGTGQTGTIRNPLLFLMIFMGSSGMLTTYFLMRRVLRQLNPSRAVPQRVRSALDTLTEGLMVLDKSERIALINQSLSETLGCQADALIGTQVAELSIKWKQERHEFSQNQVMPWSRSLQEGHTLAGSMLTLADSVGKQRSFLVNCAPVMDDSGTSHGVVASFDDVTPLEEKRAELMNAFKALQSASEKIRSQNRELEFLATRDSLTGCLNRRAFFEQFGRVWDCAQEEHLSLSCVMVDIDHFKSINDNHGHAMGDEVLRKVGAALQEAASGGDLVCRYGGEEFCVLLQDKSIERAEEAAEQIRVRLSDLRFEKLKITASLGVSCNCLKARTIQEMLDQADKSLYFSKRSGRNRVSRWDRVPADAMSLKDTGGRAASREDAQAKIPFPAVTALISALAYRDASTAEHCRRVADLCVMAGEGLMSMSDLYVLEIGALLHDIGKIGVPDHILLKPAALTEEEWTVMEQHDRIGIEIIQASFASPSLSSIVSNHHAFFGGGARHSGLPIGKDIPVGARLLAIADAYDAMVSDRVYRKGRSSQSACEELRRCAGQQFDAELVERFIHKLELNNPTDRRPTPAISKAAALSIGQQLERLAAAVDSQDLDGLISLAVRLQTTAAKEGLPEVVGKAIELEQALTQKMDLLAALRTAGELMTICRHTQSRYLQEHSFGVETAAGRQSATAVF